MTHGSSDFTAHVLELIKRTGPSGPTGPTQAKSLSLNEKSGTSRVIEAGPVAFDWSHCAAATGPGNDGLKQPLTDGGTPGTSGTAVFEEGEDPNEKGGAPPEWHAILATLERLTCPDWMPHERWDLLLGDAEIFLTRWGSTASALGWVALDLYGVHPVAPAARFDLMGFLFFVQGGSVPVITAHSALIHRRTGALLTYRRKPSIADAVLLSKVLT